MRWPKRNEVGSLGWLSWIIINKHIDSLVSSSADAAWAGVSNTGKICDILKSGVVPEFGGGGDSNAKMIRAIERLTTKDSGYAYLFEPLSPMQRLCLFAGVLAEGRKDARGVAPSNKSIVDCMASYAAELGFEKRYFELAESRYERHVSEGKSRFVRALGVALENAALEAAK